MIILVPPSASCARLCATSRLGKNCFGRISLKRPKFSALATNLSFHIHHKEMSIRGHSRIFDRASLINCIHSGAGNKIGFA